MTDHLDDEVEIDVADGRFARITHTSDSPPAVYFEYLDGTPGRATSDSAIPFEKGTVVFISGSSMRPAPDKMWNPDPQIAVVRLKLDDITIVDTGGRWMNVPTVDTVDYRRGNTVHVTTDGVVRKLDDEPLRLIEFPDLTASVVEKFKIPAPEESFDSLGGLDDVIDRANELIEVPLEHGDVLEKIGARPVRGVLLTGPAGTGKTLFARIMAAKSGAEFYLINGPEVMSKWYGQSEELLRMIFEDARKQRSIVFFDEIDSVAGRRTDTAHEASNRVVATLLTELDGFSASEHQLMVLATTNRPEDVDEALRRPGRLDWQIEFPLPDQAGRTDILRKTAIGKRVADDLPLDAIASRSDGWSGAELTSIWTEAALLAVQDKREQIEIEDFLGGWERAADRPGADVTTRAGEAVRNWFRKRMRVRRWRKDAKRCAELIREFVYLDEVSVFSLLASKDGMIATDVTDTHASTLMAETSGSFGASGGVLRADASAKAQASDTRTTQVLRKAIVQSTFRDLYQRVRDTLVIAPAPADDRAPQLGADDDLKPDGSRTWILDPSDFRRGQMIELTVELEAEPLFQARTVVSTFLDIFEQDQALLGIANFAGLADAAVLSRMIEKLGAGLVPLRAKARDYVVVTKADGTELVAHRDVVANLGPKVETAPLYLVGVATETLFWKDIRSVVFARSEVQVLARVLRPDLQSSWTPLKLVDVLARVAPQFHDVLETMNSMVLDAMAQGAASTDGSAQVRLVLGEYADLVADALHVELDAGDPTFLALLEPPEGLQQGSSVKQWRLAMAPVANHVAALAGTPVDPQVAAKLRVLAQMKHGLSPIDGRTAQGVSSTPESAKGKARLLDTEIIAIYW